MAGMLPRLTLIAAAIVPRRPGHQLLRVLPLDVLEEHPGAGTTERRRGTAVVGDHHGLAADDVFESFGAGHGAIVRGGPAAPLPCSIPADESTLMTASSRHHRCPESSRTPGAAALPAQHRSIR